MTNERVDENGVVVTDVAVNPKAVQRRNAEEAERKRLETEAAAPWSRERLDRQLKRLRTAPSDPRSAASSPDGMSYGPVVNLHGADLSGLDLSGLNLSFANMHGAKLSKADLTGASLHRANLCKADLSGAILRGCDLSNANLSEVCLCGAKASEISMQGANLSDACMSDASGIGIAEVPLTETELRQAKIGRPDGGRVCVMEGRGTAILISKALDGANVTGIVIGQCKRHG